MSSISFTSALNLANHTSNSPANPEYVSYTEKIELTINEIFYYNNKLKTSLKHFEILTGSSVQDYFTSPLKVKSNPQNENEHLE